MTVFTTRFLERRDLQHFLTGHLLGFALDDFFEGAYLGAFDSGGLPAGFIFTGRIRADGEVLVGVPHAVAGRQSTPELEERLVTEAVTAAAARASTVVAAVYSDQTPEEMARLQDTYTRLGFRFSRDSTILGRTLDGLPGPPPIRTRALGEVRPEVVASLAANCSAGTPWAEVDFGRCLNAWSSRPGFDPALFRVASIGGEPAGVMMARLDALDSREAAFYFLGVLPHFRRRGLGESLLGLGLSLMREKGAIRTRQTIPAGDGPSLRLFEKYGYRVIEWARYFRLQQPS